MIPLSGPIMVHHIIDYLSSLEISKIALVIIDGISIVQWNIIEGILKQKKSSIQQKMQIPENIYCAKILEFVS